MIYCRKLNLAQVNYTSTKHEFLSIMKNQKEFKCVQLEYQIKVYTGHINLTYKTFNTMRWRLIPVEYSLKRI